MRVLYLVGEPGAGKTSIMTALTAPYPFVQHRKPFDHMEYEHPKEEVAQLGKERAMFGGTDALSMNVISAVEGWLPTCGYDTILAEGDRLSNDRFFERATQLGGLLLFWVQVPLAVGYERRAARSNQNATWVRGRLTKVHNLVARWPHGIIDGTQPAEDNAALLRRLLWPA